MMRSGIVRLQHFTTVILLLLSFLLSAIIHAKPSDFSLPDWTPSHILREIEQSQFELSLSQSLNSDLQSLKQVAHSLLLYKIISNMAPKKFAAPLAAASGRVVDLYFDYQSSVDAQDMIIKTGLSNLDIVPGVTLPWLIRRSLSLGYSFRDSLYQLAPKPEFLFPAQPSLVYFKKPAINKLTRMIWVQPKNAQQHGGTLDDNGFFLIRPIASSDACGAVTNNITEQAILNIACQMPENSDIQIHLYPVHQQDGNRLYIRFVVGNQVSSLYQSPFDYGGHHVAFLTDPPVERTIKTNLQGNTSAPYFDITEPENPTTTSLFAERVNPLDESSWLLIQEALATFTLYPTLHNPKLWSEEDTIELNASAVYNPPMFHALNLSHEGLAVMRSGDNSVIVIDEDTPDQPPIYCLVTDTDGSTIEPSQLESIQQQRPGRSDLFRKLSMQVLHQLAFEYLTQTYITPALNQLFEHMLNADPQKPFNDPSGQTKKQPTGRQAGQNDSNGKTPPANKESGNQQQDDQPSGEDAPPPAEQSNSNQNGQDNGDESSNSNNSSDNSDSSDSSDDDSNSSSSSTTTSSEAEEMSATDTKKRREELMQRYWDGDHSPYLLAILKGVGVDDPETIPRTSAPPGAEAINSLSPKDINPRDSLEASVTRQDQQPSSGTVSSTVIENTVQNPPEQTAPATSDMETTVTPRPVSPMQTRSKTGKLTKPVENYAEILKKNNRKRPRESSSAPEPEQETVGVQTRAGKKKSAQGAKPDTKKKKSKTANSTKPQYPCPVMGCKPGQHPLYKTHDTWWKHIIDQHIYKEYLGGKEAGKVSTGNRISSQQEDFFCEFPGCGAKFKDERALTTHIKGNKPHMQNIDQQAFNAYWKSQLFRVTDELEVTVVGNQGARTPAAFDLQETYQCTKGGCQKKPVTFTYQGDQPFLVDLLNHKENAHSTDTKKLGIHAGQLLSENPGTLPKRYPTRNGQGWHCHDCGDSLQLADATIGQCPEGLTKHYEQEHFGLVQDQNGEISIRCPFRNCGMPDGSRATFHNLQGIYQHLREHVSLTIQAPRSKKEGWLSHDDIFPFVVNPRLPQEDTVEPME